MINQFVIILFLIGVCMTQIRLVSCVNVHMQKQSVLHALKDICEKLSYYDLLYKCVSRHFIINWNLTP